MLEQQRLQLVSIRKSVYLDNISSQCGIDAFLLIDSADMVMRTK